MLLVYILLVALGYLARMVHEPMLRWAYATRPRPALDITPAIARADRAARRPRFPAGLVPDPRPLPPRLGEPPSMGGGR